MEWCMSSYKSSDSICSPQPEAQAYHKAINIRFNLKPSKTGPALNNKTFNVKSYAQLLHETASYQ